MDDLFDDFGGFPSFDVEPGIPIDFDWGGVDFGGADYGGAVDLGGLDNFGFDLGGGGFNWNDFYGGIESGLDLGGASFGDMAQWYSEPAFDWDQFYGDIDSGLDLGGASFDDMSQWYSDLPGPSNVFEYGFEDTEPLIPREVDVLSGYVPPGSPTEEELKEQFWKDKFAGSGIAGGAVAIPGVGTLSTDKEGRTIIRYEDGTTKVIGGGGGGGGKPGGDGKDGKGGNDGKGGGGGGGRGGGTGLGKLTDNNALLMALLGGLLGLLGRKEAPKLPVGYQGGIPKYTATRVPGRGVEYTKAATGGLMGLAAGGNARPARYLRGGTDGMADKIQTDIEGNQPARLSHGEFVVSADVVSALGSGNSDAGADVLYDMMDRVRKHAYGRKKQITPVNKRKVLPA